MINDVMIERLDELIGDFNTPFFNYLLYSYDLSLDECEGIIDELKEDINSGEVISDNMVSTLDGRFKSRVTDLEKREKVEFLSGLIREDNDFYIRYLKRYDLSSEDVDLIYERVESKIMEDDITDFEIKRYLEYYFSNAVKQISYINDLNSIVGNDYDTLLIQSQKRAYPILQDRDIVDIVFSIHGDIIEAKEFRNGIKSEFKRQCMIRSEDKKAKCRQNLNVFVEGSGDSFSKLVKFKGLTKKDGEIIVSSIRQDINEGLIQPDSIDSVFITKRFNDYNEGQ
ncbi:hypothetical protein [Methanobrevibacter sp.]